MLLHGISETNDWIGAAASSGGSQCPLMHWWLDWTLKGAESAACQVAHRQLVLAVRGSHDVAATEGEQEPRPRRQRLRWLTRLPEWHRSLQIWGALRK